ncbi:MAG: nitrilase-related carbon-nitrogen hydrolase [Oceanococcus sp.]
MAAEQSNKTTIRVAAAQFAVGVDVDENLRNCLHWIAEAGKCKPDLLVLPEFANHASWYDDQAHCYKVSVAPDGEFVQAIAAAAKSIQAHVVVNCTVRGEGDHCTGTSLLFAPDGSLLGTNDKQVLIGHENQFLQRAKQPGPIVETAIGRLGMYACMDGVVSETPRCLALRDAQILCNSLNSFATDEGSLHIPVRAAENRVFVVAANKIGPLIPEALLEPVSQQTGIPVRFLSGAGDSQIVSPDGTVLAMASADTAEVIWADIDLRALDSAQRPDGTDVIAARRPELYAAIGQDPVAQAEPEFSGADRIEVAAVQLPGVGAGALEAAVDAVSKAAQQGSRYIVLPELFFVSKLDQDGLERAATISKEVVSALSNACAAARVALNIVESDGAGAYQLNAILLDAEGVRLRQPLMHKTQRYGWSRLGHELQSLQMDDAHVAVISGDDAIYPEVGRLLAMRGVDLLLVPCAPQEDWELRTGLVERAAENRMNLVAACQPSVRGNSLICSLQQDFTVMTPWEERPFDGLLSQPALTQATAYPGITQATVYPACAANKVVSLGTDLVRGRAWWLVEAMTKAG